MNRIIKCFTLKNLQSFPRMCVTANNDTWAVKVVLLCPSHNFYLYSHDIQPSQRLHPFTVGFPHMTGSLMYMLYSSIEVHSCHYFFAFDSPAVSYKKNNTMRNSGA